MTDDNGQLLGEAFPERGRAVRLCLGQKRSRRVSQVMLEAARAAPFLLRAEAELDGEFARCLADANAALELDPKSAAAQRPAGAGLSPGGRSGRGPASRRSRRRAEPDETEWHLVLANILLELSDFARAQEQIASWFSTSASSDALAQAGARHAAG